MFSEKTVARWLNLSPKGSEPGKLVVEGPASNWRSEVWTEVLECKDRSCDVYGQERVCLQFYKEERQVLLLILPRFSSDWTTPILAEGRLSPLQQTLVAVFYENILSPKTNCHLFSKYLLISSSCHLKVIIACVLI
jgi:hypothetical protein